MEPIYCTLCSKKCLPKEETSVPNMGAEFIIPSQENKSLKDGLQVIFLIRKILEMPQEICCNFLADYGDPCWWIDFCDSCSVLVEKGRLIVDQITALQKKFEAVQNQMTKDITQAVQFPKNFVCERKPGVKETIMSFVSQSFSNAINVTPSENATLSNFNATSSWTTLATCDINEQSQLTVKEEVEIENSCCDPFRVPLYEADDDFHEEDDPLRLEEADDCSDNNFNADLKQELLSTRLRRNEKEHNSEEVGDSNQRLVTQQSKRNENTIRYDLRKKSMRTNQKPVTVKEPHARKTPNKCDICGKVFPFKSTLIKHEKIHAGDRQYECKFCEKAYITASNLRDHERSHTGERPFKCDVCGKSFSQSGILNVHKKIHSEERDHKCSFCGKCFITASNCKAHERIHTGEKPYKCEICGKRFYASNDLKKHKRIHAGEKPYKCSYCEKSYTAANTLKDHQRVHTGEKPFKCDTCGQNFAQANALAIHKRRHTGEKPYKCEFCGKCFIASSNLSVHKRTHAGKESKCYP